MRTPGPVVDKKKIERVLALGYAEARQRKLLRARIDALLEVSVAVCDMFPPSMSGTQFYVSDVQLVRDSDQPQEVGSSLAWFDNDVRKQLEEWFGSRHPCKLLDGLILWIPDQAKVAAEHLEVFWNEFSSGLNFDCQALTHTTSVQNGQNQMSENIWHSFDQSLRVAFDAVDRESPHCTYTIRVDRRPGGPYRIRDSQPGVPYAMGYWLSNSMLLHLQCRKENAFDQDEVIELQELWKPTCGSALRTQSHTNVETRLGGTVRNQQQRSEFIRPRQSGAQRSRSELLEEKAWGVPPRTIFMAPLSNHDLCVKDADIQVVGHLYFPAGNSEDCLDLLTKKHRLSRIFNHSLLNEYYRTLAHQLAEKVADGWTASGIDSLCCQLAGAYGGMPPLRVWAAHEKEEVPSLSSCLQVLREKGLINWAETRFSTTFCQLLRRVALDWPDEETELAVIRYLVSDLELQPARRDSVLHITRDEIRTNLDTLEKAISDVRRITRSLRDNVSRDRKVRLDVVKALDEYWEGRLFPCKQKEQGLKPREVHGTGWSFYDAHNLCSDKDCTICASELNERLAFVLGVKKDMSLDGVPAASAAKDRLFRLCSMDRSECWEVLKQASKYAKEMEPTIGGIVLLMLMDGADIELTAKPLNKLWGERIRLPESRWPESLGGIVALAEPDRKHSPMGKTSSVLLDWTAGVLSFRLQHGDCAYEGGWIKKIQEEFSRAEPRWTSRARDLAAVLLYGEGGHGISQAWITVAVDGKDAVVKWVSCQ